jgi:P-type Mg2+ transporter
LSSLNPQDILQELKSSLSGLSSKEASLRSPLISKKQKQSSIFLSILLRNFSSPIAILLLLCACFSVYVRDTINALIIFSIVLISSLISFFQELKAHKDTKALIEALKTKQQVLRDGIKVMLDPDQLVVGDILIIDAGDLIPKDCVLVESTDIYVNESSLTGESLPKEKHVHLDPFLKMGSCVVSGLGKACVINQPQENTLIQLFDYLSKKEQTSSFSHSLYIFSKFLMKATIGFTFAVFLILTFFKTSVLTALLFSLSIAVGLSPQLLPAILTTNLAIGARKMAQAGALTKRLESIENFGNIDLLACDKTGTLTKGHIELYAALDQDGLQSDEVRLLSFFNSKYQTGFPNALDEAVINANSTHQATALKLDEIPYDFNRKILSILVEYDKENILIAKGALENILSKCHIDEALKTQILERANTYYSQGFRLLGIAKKTLATNILKSSDENDMIFKGFLLFFDPMKEDTPFVLQKLKELGIRLVMITGDHPLLAKDVAYHAGFSCTEVLDTSHQDIQSQVFLDKMRSCDIYARVNPLQKARIIEQFKQMGYTVGFLGDGINDAGALFAADVGISVDSGSDMAKATADFILIRKSLNILTHAVKEGRKIFGNTIKYILMALSANFGNMFSMAGVALFIPFLPLLPTQILLINFLQDFPEMSISLDNVDHEIMKKPQKWNLSFIKKFMMVFGPISSIFDFATFFAMKYFMATPEMFRSAWFTESVLSATFIILFIRTRFSFYKSRPSWILLTLVFSIIIFTLLIPYTPLGPLFDIIVLPAKYYVAIFMIVITYALVVELAKKVFYSWTYKKHMTLS